MESNKKIILLVAVMFLLGVFAIYQINQQRNNKDDAVKNGESTQEEKPSDKNVPANNNPTQESETDIAQTPETGIIYFYGNECPHCKDVLAYLEKNDIYSKVDFVKKEVWHNKKNGEELRNAALKCGLNPSNIGVPFVFSEGKCFMGGPDVMKFFGEKAGIN